MNRFVRRIGPPRKGDESASTPAGPGAPGIEPSAFDVEKMTAYSVQPRSDAMSNEPEYGDDATSQAAMARGSEQDELLDYVQVGERVTAVLESARDAAEDIRAKARREAERVRAEADDQAASTVAEAERNAEEMRRESEQLRAEAKHYSTETREAADSYAAENRREADAAATRMISEAEERVRKARAEAKRKAKQTEEEGLKRQAAIVAEAGRFEDRLQKLLTVFRGMTDQLEDLLAKGEGDEEMPAGETLQESLEDPLKRKGSKVPSA